MAMKTLLLFTTALLFLCGEIEAQEEVNVTVYTTTESRSLDLSKSELTLDSHNKAEIIIRINRSVRYQAMDGFGAAITGSSAYNLSLMPAEKRQVFRLTCKVPCLSYPKIL